MRRAKEWYKEQLRRDSEKELEATRGLVMITCETEVELMEKLRDLLKRMEWALGEENRVTLDTLNIIGGRLRENGESETAIKVYERCLARRTKVLGEDRKTTLNTLMDLEVAYDSLGNYEKVLEYYERTLEGKEQTLGKTHPSTLTTVGNIAIVY